MIFYRMKPENFLSRYLVGNIVKYYHRPGTYALYDQHLEKHPMKISKIFNEHKLNIFRWQLLLLVSVQVGEFCQLIYTASSICFCRVFCYLTISYPSVPISALSFFKLTTHFGHDLQAMLLTNVLKQKFTDSLGKWIPSIKLHIKRN